MIGSVVRKFRKSGRFVCWLCSVAIAMHVAGDFQRIRAADKPEKDGLNAETRKRVSNQMRKILDQTTLKRLGREGPVNVELVREPVLNWDDVPRGHHYGTLWVWGARGRPAAIIEIYTINFATEIDGWPGNVMHSLVTDPLAMTSPSGWSWSPNKSGCTLKPVPSSPAVAATKTARILQMRSLAKGFTANQTWLGDYAELRLLTTPIRLYESPEDGVLDGGMFVFAHGGTNPEVILVLEARRHAEVQSWEFGCVRLGHAQMQVNFDRREVWAVDRYDQQDPTASYFSMTR